MLDETVKSKIEKVNAALRGLGSALVAYSGGVDSALMLALAHRELGERVLACIGVSPSYPKREREGAVALAKSLGVRYEVVETGEHLDPRYAANPAERCYYCKSDLYERLRGIAAEQGLAAVVDGSNADDLKTTDRPGMAAGKERGVRSLLAEAGITKADVRAIAREMDLPVWDKPSMACLSSRVPQGVTITPQLLLRIESAENLLADLGFRQYRVRHHGAVARVELPAEDLARAVEMREAIVDGLKGLGWKFVALDLSGFHSGSLSAAGKSQGAAASEGIVS